MLTDDTSEFFNVATEDSPITNLPADVLRKIFSYFPMEDRILCLERVCKRWKECMVYSEMQNLNVTELHRKLCRKGSTCPIEFNKRYHMINRKSLKIWLSKFLTIFTSRCAHTVRSVDVSGFTIDGHIVSILRLFPRLCELNITNCDISPRAAEDLSEISLQLITMEGVELGNEVLKNLRVNKIDLTAKISPTFLPNNITYLKIRSLTDLDELTDIVENCCSLNSFHVSNTHSLQSLALVDTLQSSIGNQLLCLTLALHPSTFGVLCGACPNLVELKLRGIQDRHMESNLNEFLTLESLEKFSLTCRWLNEHNLLEVLYRCDRLKDLEINAKRITKSNRLVVIPKQQLLMIENLKLSLDCITVTTRIAASLVAASPNVKKVKLMSRKMKQCYATEHGISNDAFCAEYYEAVYASKNLRNVSLPFLSAENNSEFLDFVWHSSIQRLYIFGGTFYFEENDDVLKLPNYANLTHLIFGPYFQSFAGLETFLPLLTNLQHLSFHIDASTWPLLEVIGSLKSLRVFELRSCGKYFMEMLNVQMIPLLNCRRNLKSRGFYLSPLLFNVFVKHSDYPSLSRKLELEFDSVAIRFKVCRN